MAVNQGLKRTAMNTSLSAPVMSSTTATSTITLSMIMKYEPDNATENATVNQSLSMRDYSEERLFQAVYLGYLWTALIIGLPGNVIIAVVYVVIRQKRTSDWFIFFLSVYDCAVCVFAVPLYLSIETGAWMDSGSDLACKIEQFTIFTAQFSSVCMLGIIAVDRYLKICHPTKRSLNAVQARNLGFCISLVSAIVASPILVWDGNVERRYCRVQEKYKGSLGVKAHLCLTFGFFLCVFFVVIFCYSHVCIVVRRRIKRHRENALKRKHLMQIPAFLQAISNVDDPHGLSGHPGRNKKRFSLFSIGSSRRLSAISPWIKARLSLPSDGVGRKLANPEDEKEVASKESLVDIKRQLDYALMFRTKTSSIEERYGDAKDGVFQELGEYKGNVDEIRRNDIIENLQTVGRASKDTSNMLDKRQSICNGFKIRSQINSSSNQSDDSVFEHQGGSQVSQWGDLRANPRCQSRAQRLTLSYSDTDSNCHKQETSVVIETDQSHAINYEIPVKTNADEQTRCGDLENDAIKYNTTHNMSQNVNEENTSNDNSEIKTISGSVDDVCGKEGSAAFLGNNYGGLNSVCECASSKKSSRTFHSECCRCQNESLQAASVRGNSPIELTGHDVSNRCSANIVQERADSASLSHSLLSLFTRSRRSNFRQSSPKGKGRGKRCRSASCLVSPKHIKKLSRNGLSEQGENITQSYSDLRVIQSYFTKPDWQWKNCTHQTPSKSMAFEESNNYKKCGCQKFHCKHHMQERAVDGACGKSPRTGSPVHIVFSPKRGVHQSVRSTLVRDLNYINLPYTKLIDDEVSEASGEGGRRPAARRMSCNPAEDIYFLIGCDDDDYVDDDVRTALLDNSDTNRFAGYKGAKLPDYRYVAENRTERDDNRCPAIGVVANHNERCNHHHRALEFDACKDYLYPIRINDENHISKHQNLETPLLLSHESRHVPCNKRRSEEVNCSLHTDFEDCYRKTRDMVPTFVDIAYGQSHIQHSDTRSCDKFTGTYQVTNGQQLFNDVVNMHSVITDNSNDRSLGGKTSTIGENTINNAAGTKISDSAGNNLIGLYRLCEQSKLTSYKSKDVFQPCSHNVWDTLNECCNSSPQDALDNNMKHGVKDKEWGHCERGNTSLDPAQTLDSQFLAPNTSCQDNLPVTNFHTNNLDDGHINENNSDNMGIYRSGGLSSVWSSGVPSEVPAEVPAEVPSEVSAEASAEVPSEVTSEVPAEVPSEVPAEVPSEVPSEVPAEVPSEVPSEVSAEASSDVPAEVPAEVPSEVPTEVPAEVPANSETLSFGGGFSNNVLFKDNVHMDTDHRLLDTEVPSGLRSTMNADRSLNKWQGNANTSHDLTEEQELKDHSDKMETQNDGIRCRCGHIYQSVPQMNPAKVISDNVTGGRRYTGLKQNTCKTPLVYSTPAKLTVYYDNHCNSCDSAMREMYRSQGPTREAGLVCRTEAKSVNCSNICPEFEDLTAGNRSPDKRGKYNHSSDPSDNPYKVGLVSYHHCSTCLAKDAEPDNECSRYLQPCWTSNKCERKQGARLFAERDKVQQDTAMDSSNEVDVKKTSSTFSQHDQSCLCASSKDLQPCSSNQNCFVDTHHQLWSGTITYESPYQTSDTYPSIDNSPTPRQTGECSPLKDNTGRHSLDISERLHAIADKASEFDFSRCDECLVVSCIEFLPEKDISLVARIMAAVFNTRLAKNINENCAWVSSFSLPQNVFVTTPTSPNHYNFDIITLSSLHILTNRSFLFHRSDLVWDISNSAHFYLPTVSTSFKNSTPEPAFAHLHTNPDFVNDPLGLDMLEFNSTCESSVESLMIETHSTLNSNTSLKDNIDVKSGMVDAVDIIWTSSRDTTTPFFISANVRHYDNFCHCKYFWSRFLKEFFNNEVCPLCLKPVDFSGFSVFLHSHPSSMPLISSDKSTFEKWLCKTELDRLGQKSMIQGECPILVYGDGPRNGGVGILCCSRVGTREQNMASGDLVYNRNISSLGDEGHRRLDALEIPAPVWGDGVRCETASTSYIKDGGRNDSQSFQNYQSLNNGRLCTNKRVEISNSCISPSTTVSVNESAHITSVIINDADASSLLCTDSCDVHRLSCFKPPIGKVIPCGEIRRDIQTGNESGETDFNREENMSQCKKKWSDNVPGLQDYITEKEHLNSTENTQSQSSMKIIQTVHEAYDCERSSRQHLNIPPETSPRYPNDRMRQCKLLSSNIVNCALNSLVPLAVGSTRHEVHSVCGQDRQDHRRNSLHMASTLTHQHITPLDIEISSSSNTTSENGDTAMALPKTTKSIHSALLGCVPTFQVDDFALKSNLQDVKVPHLETCQFFVRTVFDTFFTSNSCPFKSDPCLSASDIDYANSELLVFPLSPLFCRTAHGQKENNENGKVTSVYHIDDHRRQSLNSAFDMYDARVRKIRSPKRNGPTQSWFSLDDLSSKPTSSRHASMVFLASLRRQLNNVLSPKSIRQFFGINNQQDNKASARRPPCSRDTLSTNQINVIITRCDSLVMDKRQEMGLPPIRDRAATLDPAFLDKSIRVSHNSIPSNMGTNVSLESRSKPRASSLDTSYSSNTHSDDPSLLCRSQDLSLGRSREASLDLLSPTSASFRTGSMCSGISNLSRLTECSAYTENSRSDCEKITRRTAEREHNITKLLGAITLVFVLSWSVSWSVILIDNLTVFPVTDMLATNVTLSIARNLFLVNHFCNILVYMVLSRSFRDKMTECYTRCLSFCRV